MAHHHNLALALLTALGNGALGLLLELPERVCVVADSI